MDAVQQANSGHPGMPRAWRTSPKSLKMYSSNSASPWIIVKTVVTVVKIRQSAKCLYLVLPVVSVRLVSSLRSTQYSARNTK
ncbi:MAG: hypothetical protein ACRETA_02125 [Gammaproteobacteria bacterium]